MRIAFTAVALLAAGAALVYGRPDREPPYPPSPVIGSIYFEMSSLRELAPGSDNWPVTWASDGRQYTSWGDGGGFGGTNSRGRVSFGVGRIEGGPDDYRCFNVWGGAGLPKPEIGGKSYGILALNDTLWMWRGGDASDESIYGFQQLLRSVDEGRSWQDGGVTFDRREFSDTLGVYALNFLQFGKGYEGARDQFVYVHAPRATHLEWDAHTPGDIMLLRAPRDKLDHKVAWQWFAGVEHGRASWTGGYDDAEPVFRDAANGVMRTGVNYNEGLERYFLCTQQVSRFRDKDGHVGIYDAPTPWGPWTTVLFANAFEHGIVDFSKTVFFNFSNKWTSADGERSVMVYTNRDNWATVESELYPMAEPIKIAHRGASGERPENTLAAFARAVELGADMVELDVRASADNRVVVIHDDTVERTTGGSGKVADMSLDELRKLDAGGGERIPTLVEALEATAGRCGVNVEIKGEGLAAAVARVLAGFIEANGLDWSDYLVSSFDHGQLAELKRIEPRLRRAPLFGGDLPADYIATAHELGAWSVNLNAGTVTTDVVRDCRTAGLRVLMYTVNDPGEIARCRELGVHGIIGDYPDRL